MATLTLKKKPKKESELAKARKWVKSQLPEAPYAIGIKEQLLAIKPDDVSKKFVIQSIKRITRTIEYLRSFELAKYRTDIHGEKTDIEENHRAFANGVLLERSIQKEKQKKLAKMLGEK